MTTRALLLLAVVAIPGSAALKISGGALPPATVGTAYSAALQASGGKLPYQWAIVGSLPDGLDFNTTTAEISGLPSASGQFPFTAGVTDANNGTDSQNFTIKVAPTPVITTASLPDARLGSSYSATLNATGGSTPLSWSATGLPPALSVHRNGHISGTPQSLGTFSVTASLLDAAGANTSSALPLKVTAALTITTTNLPGGTLGTAYSATLAADGGTPPYGWSLSAGTLPAGLLLTPDGQIGGTPTAAGAVSFTVTVQDASNATATKPLSIAVTDVLSVTTTALPDGTQGSPYSATLAAAGGSGSYTWSVTGGTLPAGLSLAANGKISGTPTASGAANFTVTVSDGASTASKPLSITIAPPALTITTTSLPDGLVGTAYTATLAASGGTGSYTWAVTAGSLPAGLSLAPAGAISGTPTSAGTANFTVSVTDAANTTVSKALSIRTTAPALNVTTTSLPDGVVGTAYTATLTASGGTGSYTWAVTAGALPAGLSLAPTGEISGTPTAAGNSNFTVTVTDSANTTKDKALSIHVTTPALAITTTTLPDGVAGTAYSATLAASGGTAPYTWAVTAGSLPAGLSLSTDGQITGTPTTAATSNFTATVTDSANAKVSKALSIRVAPAALTITTTSLPDGVAGTAYSATLAASGGTGAYTWAVTQGALPAGLALATNGQISGTPTAAGTSNFTVTVTDAANATATKALTIRVNAPTLTITTISVPNGTVGVPYSASLNVTGGTPPYSWAIAAGGLPAGLNMDANGGITGTPTTAGTSPFTVRATDAANTSNTKELTLTVAPPPISITTTSLPGGTAGTAYSATLNAQGGTAPYSWSVTGGALPAGLSLSAAGQISGTPTAPGTANFAVTVSDTNHTTANAQLSLAINATPLAITTTSLPSGTTGTAYAAPVAASGGTPPYTWTVTSGALPPGLALSGSQIAGTPTSAGAFNFGIRATDTRGVTADAALSIRVLDALAIQLCPTPSAVAGQPYSSTATGTGGVTPYAWAISAGQLPPGINVDSGSGAFSGTPTQSGGFTFTIRLTDATSNSVTRACGINVTPALAIPADTLPAGVAGASYSFQFKATGGTPPYSWAIAAGSLPPGLGLDPGSGSLSGTALQTGTFNFTVRVTDKAGAQATGNFQIVVSPGLTITSCPTGTAAIGRPYRASLAAAGGASPYTWSVTGSLPAGIQLSGSDLQGTPSELGTFAFTLRVADSVGASNTRDCSLLVTNAFTLTTTQLPGGSVGASYSQKLSAAGGSPPYSWSTVAGALPPGLTLNSATGQITGTPTTAGTFSFTGRATDANGLIADSNLAITITAGFAITDCPNPAATVGQDYSAVANASGGQPPYTWSISSGGLPTGLTLAAPTGSITGRPSELGTTAFTLRAADTAGVIATRACTIAVNPATLTITNSGSLPDAPIGTPYNVKLVASGGRSPYTWAVVGGSLPPGIKISAAGDVTGTATEAGEFTFTVRVTDADRNVATQILRLAATPGPSPAVHLTGIQPIAAPAQQMFVDVNLDQGYPVDITGTLQLTFTADPGLTDDPAVQFAGGGRSVPFTIPANTTKAVFANSANGLQTGTVAGTIHFDVALQASGVNITPSPSPAQDMRVDRLAPRITGLTVTRTSSGIEVRITAFSTTRELTAATFRFTPAAGSSVQQTEFTVPLTDPASQWFADSRSVPFGSQFVLVEPFTVQGASLSAVSVTLTNGQGTSAAVSATF